MPVRFIFGRAGSGKTQWCFDQIIHRLKSQPLGKNIYWILPRQATFQAQRMLACGSGLGGYFRVRVLSFEELSDDILAECGGGAAAQVSDRGRTMILGHLLRTLGGKLKFFDRCAHQPGVAGDIDATFSELERGGLDATGIRQQLQPELQGSALDAKLQDLELIWAEYGKFLGQDRLDPNRRLTQAMEDINRCPSLQGAEVFVDSFYELTGYERRMIAQLAKVCRQVSIALLIDPSSSVGDNPEMPADDLGVFHRTMRTYCRLRKVLADNAIPIESAIILQECRRFQNPSLEQLERWDIPASNHKSGAEVELIETPDRRAEVDAAARWIKRLVATGLRYRDIAVLMRHDSDYGDFIAASFAEHSIPFFMDRRRTAWHHPLLRLIRSALAIARNNWPHDAVMEVAKCGLAGISSDEADHLENFVLMQGIRRGLWRSPEPWKGRELLRDEEGNPLPPSEQVQRADEIRRRLLKHFEPFIDAVTASKQISVRTLASAIFTLLESMQVRATIVQWMDRAQEQSQLEERAEHERVWEETAALFEEMVELLGEERISLDDFSSLVDSALERFDLALRPPTVDQVLVGPVDRTRTPALKATVVLGLSEGQFPSISQETSVFTDADRRTLLRHQLDLEPDSERKLMDEEFLGYLAFTRGSEYLLLTRSTADAAGRPLGESPLWQRVREHFPQLAVGSQNNADRSLNDIATPRQLLGAMMEWVRSDAPAGPLDAVYQWLAGKPQNAEALNALCCRAWVSLSHENNATLAPERVAAMFPSPLHLSVGQLESFRRCPFQHFVEYGLNLQERPDDEVTKLDLSQMYHQMIQRFVGELIQSRRKWSDLDETTIRDSVARIVDDLGKRWMGQRMVSTARNRYLLGRMRRTLESVVWAQRAAGERGSFAPHRTNVHFGQGGERPADMPPLQLDTPKGNHIALYGKIDRVDLLDGGFACALDYRTTASGLSAAEVFHGLSLRLLSFLLALRQNGSKLTGKTLEPVAALSVPLLRFIQETDPDRSLDPDDPKFHLRVKPRGVFEAEYATKFDSQLQQGFSSVLQVFIKADGEIGHADKTDAANHEDFQALLEHAAWRMGELADKIIAGQIQIKPYRLGQVTPCEQCSFRDVCRFEPRPGSYENLESMNRVTMLQRIRQEDKR